MCGGRSKGRVHSPSPEKHEKFPSPLLLRKIELFCGVPEPVFVVVMDSKTHQGSRVSATPPDFRCDG